MAVHDHQDVKHVLAQIAAVNKAVVALWEAIHGGSLDPLMIDNYRGAVSILGDKRKLLETMLEEKIAEVAYKEACGG